MKVKDEIDIGKDQIQEGVDEIVAGTRMIGDGAVKVARGITNMTKGSNGNFPYLVIGILAVGTEVYRRYIQHA